ncbi:hypothetical protein CCACVL1_21771 [Corchorus capsularis]|uniref:Uncharacterized protein n=1 Tax=Corchorus capsularis TaxID=210143 RepID=A0A1R3H243_COCAP|nr:hypothetical protein CCACVL1_21771 [Corchorus capsularis]
MANDHGHWLGVYASLYSKKI